MLQQLIEAKLLPPESESEIRSLNGKHFEMLDERESEWLKFYRQRGRKYGIQILIENKASADELSLARSSEYSNVILKRAGPTITVIKNVNEVGKQN